MEHIFNLLGSFFTWITSYSYIALFTLTIVDILLGTAKAFSQKKINSTIAKEGMTKNLMILVVPALLLPLADLMGYADPALTLLTFLVLAQGYSVLENWIALGLPFKESWRNYFDDEKIKQKENPGTTQKEFIEKELLEDVLTEKQEGIHEDK
ncbi:phage holin family protein [Weissella viridescens]